MRDIRRHMDGEELEQYSVGTSSPEETAALEEHLLTCEQCREQLQTTDEYVLAMRSAALHERQQAPVRRREWRSPAWFPALAAAACGLLILIAARSWMAPVQPAVAINLIAMRGARNGSTAPADRGLLVHADLTGLAPAATYGVQIVDQDGREVRRGQMQAARNTVQFAGLRAGTYFVRIYLPRGE